MILSRLHRPLYKRRNEQREAARELGGAKARSHGQGYAAGYRQKTNEVTEFMQAESSSVVLPSPDAAGCRYYRVALPWRQRKPRGVSP